jgi:hypothetical protein
MSYARYRRDFEALERIAELDEQVELDAARLDLMRNPTKARAAAMYLAAIEMWFAEHGAEAAPKLAKRYGIE